MLYVSFYHITSNRGQNICRRFHILAEIPLIKSDAEYELPHELSNNLKSDSRLPKKLFCLLHWKCSLKIMKNVFYFTLKVLFLFKILRFFVSTFWKFEIRKLQEFWNAWNWWRVPCRLPKWKNLCLRLSSEISFIMKYFLYIFLWLLCLFHCNFKIGTYKVTGMLSSL